MAEPKPPQGNAQEQKNILPLSEKNQILKDRISNIYKNIPRDNLIEFMDEVATKAAYLRDKYSDCEKREVFHVLAGSGLKPGSSSEIIEDDFTDDPVEEFIETLEEKYKKHNDKS